MSELHVHEVGEWNGRLQRIEKHDCPGCLAREAEVARLREALQNLYNAATERELDHLLPNTDWQHFARFTLAMDATRAALHPEAHQEPPCHVPDGEGGGCTICGGPPCAYEGRSET